MRVMELPKPEELFDVPADLLGVVSENIELDTPVAYGILIVGENASYYVYAGNQPQWDGVAAYANYLAETSDRGEVAELLVQARKLYAEPGELFIAGNDARGWHVDPIESIAVADRIPTEYLVGYVDMEAVAKTLGGTILRETIPGSDEHIAQIELLNFYKDVKDIPGELEIVQFEPLRAVWNTPFSVHRRPKVNDTNKPVVRTFANAQPLYKK